MNIEAYNLIIDTISSALKIKFDELEADQGKASV